VSISANLDKILDKAHENMELTQLVDAPIDALAGVTAADAEALTKALGIKTIGDLGRNKHFRAAAAIAQLADASK